jgi:hypothetical protein
MMRRGFSESYCNCMKIPLWAALVCTAGNTWRAVVCPKIRVQFQSPASDVSFDSHRSLLLAFLSKLRGFSFFLIQFNPFLSLNATLSFQSYT